MEFPLVVLLLLVTPSGIAGPAFDDAEAATTRLDFPAARELYRLAVNESPDAGRREIAAVRLANIEWRIDHEPAAAERDLGRVRDDGEQASSAWIERARMKMELDDDFDGARRAALRALHSAKQERDRNRASALAADAAVRPVLRARLGGRCEDAATLLALAASEFEALIRRAGPTPEAAAGLLDAALLRNDGKTALRAFRLYYGTAGSSTVLAPAAATLAARLPRWRGVRASASDRRALGLALAESRFFDEADLVLRDPCGRDVVADDPAVAGVIAYAAALRSLRREVDGYYRGVALRRAQPDDLRRTVDETLRSLWPAIRPPGGAATYTESAALDEVRRRFGTVVALGNTANTFDLHLGHAVVDEERRVSQYGRTASLRFVVLDGIVSNGYGQWASDGRSGDGGWTNTAIYQVRPRYAGGPWLLWSRVENEEARAQHGREIAEESARDDQRVALDPDQMPRGESLRLEEQYLDRLLASLRASGLGGDALRDAFVARVTSDQLESSIWAHEGRHAIDKAGGVTDSAELEFRAKLSEVALAPAPRRSIGAIAFDTPPTTPHGAANRRIGAALGAWMRAHAAEVEGLDGARPMLLQVDRLTDDQMRAAFRSMDPLASPGATPPGS